MHVHETVLNLIKFRLKLADFLTKVQCVIFLNETEARTEKDEGGRAESKQTIVNRATWARGKDHVGRRVLSMNFPYAKETHFFIITCFVMYCFISNLG